MSENKKEEKNTNNALYDSHVYDNTAKELAICAPRLLLRVAKKMFHKDYPTDTKVEFLPNDYIKTDKEGLKHDISSDLCFHVLMEKSERELCIVEVQSTNDSSIMGRAIEYALLTMIREKNKDADNKITDFHFPNIGVLFLREPSASLLKENFVFHFPNQKTFELKPAIIDASSYTIAKDLQDGLHFLLPFHILALEDKLEQLHEKGEDTTFLLTETYKEMYQGIKEAYLKKELDQSEMILLNNAMEYVFNNVKHYRPYIDKGGITMNKQTIDPSLLKSDRDFIFNLDPSKFLVFQDYIRLEQEKLKQGILEQDRIREEKNIEVFNNIMTPMIKSGKEENVIEGIKFCKLAIPDWAEGRFKTETKNLMETLGFSNKTNKEDLKDHIGQR